MTISRVKFPWPPFSGVFLFFDEIFNSVCGTTYLMRGDGATVVNVRLNEHEVGAQAVGEFLGVPGDHGQLRSRSPCSSAPGAAVVSSRDEDAVAPPRRLDPLLYDQLRAIQQSFTKEMYDYAVAYLQRTLERTPTEAKGDCWLLTKLAGFEIKHRDLVHHVTPEQRESICTLRRNAIVDRAANSKLNGSFKLLCELCAIDAGHHRQELGEEGRGRHLGAAQSLAHAEALWQGPGHHAPVYGLVLGAQHPGYRYEREPAATGLQCALNATPCPLAATHNLLCLCAVGMYLQAFVDRAGRGIDHRDVYYGKITIEPILNP